jgi:hypothetical protein
MTRSFLGRAAFAVAVVTSLGFGVQQAVAAPAAARNAKPYCADDPDCQSICESLYPGQAVISDCSANHICYCGLAR